MPQPAAKLIHLEVFEMSSSLKGRILFLGTFLITLLLSLAAFQKTVVAVPDESVQDGSSEISQAIQSAAAWLVAAHQNADGGFSSFSTGADQAPSDIGGTLDALWALGLTGADVTAPLSFLEDNPEQMANYVAKDGSAAGKALLVVNTTDRDFRDFAGLDLVVAVTDYLSPTGQFGVNTAFNQSLALLGLSIAGQSVPEESIEWLVAQQATEGEFAGSWDDGFGTPGNPDSTALALAALVISGQSADVAEVEAGLAFLEQAQLESGGWEYGTGFGENANSTALVILALTMLGEDVSAEGSRWVKDGADPIGALLAWQGDSGAFQVDLGDGRVDDFFSTVQALPALGFLAMRSAPGPVQAPVVTAQEMTPTATSAVVEPTPTTKPATSTPEPTEARPTETPEPVAVGSDSDQTDASAADGDTDNDVEVGEATADNADGGGSSIWPWLLVGGVIAFALLAWRLLARREEV